MVRLDDPAAPVVYYIEGQIAPLRQRLERLERELVALKTPPQSRWSALLERLRSYLKGARHERTS